MRTLLIAGVAIASFGGLAADTAHAADFYQPAPGYSVTPPASTGVSASAAALRLRTAAGL